MPHLLAGMCGCALLTFPRILTQPSSWTVFVAQALWEDNFSSPLFRRGSGVCSPAALACRAKRLQETASLVQTFRLAENATFLNSSATESSHLRTHALQATWSIIPIHLPALPVQVVRPFQYRFNDLTSRERWSSAANSINYFVSVVLHSWYMATWLQV